MDIFSGLNPAQQEAVACLEGPLLIMAGAGSGKTRVLTHRIANLLEHGAAPYSILAITFTNKAAAEMRERVENMIGPMAKDIWLSTFHSFCARFLRREIESTGMYKSNFVIYDSGDSQTVVKKVIRELNLDEKQYNPGGIRNAISNAKNQMLGPMAFEAQASDFYQKKVAEVYKGYQKLLRENNALDFDDLLLVTVSLLSENEEIRSRYSARLVARDHQRRQLHSRLRLDAIVREDKATVLRLCETLSSSLRRSYTRAPPCRSRGRIPVRRSTLPRVRWRSHAHTHQRQAAASHPARVRAA